MSEREIPYGLLPDWAIREYIKIEPFANCEPRPGIISYGTSSYGYDVRLGRVFKLFSPIAAEGMVIDPKKINDSAFVTVEGDQCIIPPQHYALAETFEYMEIPRDVTVICIGKSSYARCGIITNVTPLEAAWRGKVTLEISNACPLPVTIHAGEGICQLLFFRAEAPCEISYADKRGIYQDQKGLTLTRVRE